MTSSFMIPTPHQILFEISNQ